MTVRPRSRKSASVKLTKGDIKLIICVLIFAASVALKYANADTAQTLRVQAAALLHGGQDTGEVIEAMGRVIGDEGILAVFGESSSPQDETPVVPAVTSPEAESPTTAEGTASEETVPVYAEGGFSEDLEDREQTLFPKVADETAYVMQAAHVQPTVGTLSSDYGGRTHPISGKQSFHFGLDIAAPKGTPIVSLADGTVRETGGGSYGNYLIVDHDDGFSTLYAHCDKLIAKKGETVKVGQEIAQVGATGNATGNHLHFEVWRDGKALDPRHYVTYT